MAFLQHRPSPCGASEGESGVLLQASEGVHNGHWNASMCARVCDDIELSEITWDPHLLPRQRLHQHPIPPIANLPY